MVISTLAGPLTIPDIYASEIFAPWESCDSRDCPAQALLYVTTARGSVTLCGHHGDRVTGALPLPGTWRACPASAESGDGLTDA